MNRIERGAELKWGMNNSVHSYHSALSKGLRKIWQEEMDHCQMNKQMTIWLLIKDYKVFNEKTVSLDKSGGLSQKQRGA